MKLLIIAGPYEADRIRRAAVSAGFETVAIEPGESLSGWISATRPDLIVMAPQIVNPDPVVALAKVRATPRGRVPIFFVGDAADQERFAGLADGFLVRPIAPADLIAQARARVVLSAEKSGPIPRPPAPVPDSIPGAIAAVSSGPKSLPALGLKPLISEGDAGAIAAPPANAPAASVAPVTPVAAPVALVAQATMAPRPSRRANATGARHTGAPAELLRHLSDSIDASLDAEMLDVARGLAREPPTAPNTALAELRDESSQKTREVDSDVVVRMMMMQEGVIDTDAKGKRLTVARDRPALAPAQEAAIPAPSETGPIGSPDIAILLGRIYFERLTGRLTFRRGAAEKTIFFDRGAPILARSNLSDDRMGEMLARQGRLSREQRARGAGILESTGRRIGGVLVELGALKDSELVPLVRRHFEEIIYSVFTWPEGGDAPADEGEWTLGPEPVNADESIRLDLRAPAVIMEGIRRKYTAPRLLRRLGGGAQVMQLLAADAATSSILDDMALSDEERTLVRRFDGVRTLDEIRTAANVADEVPCGLAWALVALRSAVATRAADADADATRVAAAASTSISASTSTSASASAHGNGAGATEAGELSSPRDDEADRARARARTQAIDRARILSRFALVQDGDYFQLLGLPREATAHEVRRAHQVLTRELSGQTLDAALATELDSELRAIRIVLDEGARILGDPRLRRRYQAHLPVAPTRRPE